MMLMSQGSVECCCRFHSKRLAVSHSSKRPLRISHAKLSYDETVMSIFLASRCGVADFVLRSSNHVTSPHLVNSIAGRPAARSVYAVSGHMVRRPDLFIRSLDWPASASHAYCRYVFVGWGSVHQCYSNRDCADRRRWQCRPGTHPRTVGIFPV